MVARCSLCNEIITTKNPGQFFPEDDSYICGICQREHKRTLEKIGSHSHKMDFRTWAADAFVTKSSDKRR